MNSKYYIRFRKTYIIDTIVYKKRKRKNQEEYIYLIKTNKGSSLDSMLEDLYDLNNDILDEYELYLDGIDMIIEYKQLIRNNKIKTLLNFK